MQGGIALQQIKRIGKKRGEFEVSRTNNHQQQERLDVISKTKFLYSCP
jgi:hypothetical protein